MPARPPFEVRLWSKIDRRADDVCWPWMARLNTEGYGTIRRHGKMQKAHRVMWEMTNNQAIPDGLVVRHKCDNRRCVNPNHLELGTQRDNVRDAVERGQHSCVAKMTRTHCKHGHEYTPENTDWRRGWRDCRACERAKGLRRYYAAKAKRSAA